MIRTALALATVVAALAFGTSAVPASAAVPTCVAGQPLAAGATCYCPIGKIQTTPGHCVSNTAFKCPAGYYQVTATGCAAYLPAKDCVNGQPLVTGTCAPVQCPALEIRANGACYVPEALHGYTCPSGQDFNDSGFCIPNADPGTTCAVAETAAQCGPGGRGPVVKQESLTTLAGNFRTWANTNTNAGIQKLSATCRTLGQGPVAPDTHEVGWPNGIPAQCTITARYKNDPITFVGTFVSYHGKWDLLSVTEYVLGVETQTVHAPTAKR